ncbi:hypothetical protein HPB47_028034 [Ixodes persulcatus]|uniref:Uncharacterized protein n=1 Tax=Ixodes persulcatus TaxID=34615 RepID=A0AC60PUB4_IXOPE|nr:hypothetical protein HPB47_028034 [Ixodes persulcatus]
MTVSETATSTPGADSGYQEQNNGATAANDVAVLGDENLPGEVEEILKKGPKFSYEPSSRRHEILAMVRQVADREGYQARERAIGDGVDPLRRTYPQLHQGAVPHKFRNCPNYLSSDVNVREDPEARKYAWKPMLSKLQLQNIWTCSKLRRRPIGFSA